MINTMAATLVKLRVLLFLLVAYYKPCYGVDSLRFLVLGDWGGLPDTPFTTKVETSVAKQMGTVADKYGPQFILALGDNFYFDGVKDVEDKRFKETYESVYTNKSLMIPWNLVAGNHDHHGNVSAQIAYSKVDTRWNFPDYYYKLSYKIPPNETMDIVMIDTVLLCGNTGHDELHNQPLGPENPLAADKQLAWIQQTLKASTADFLLVAGHYPVYSIAEHGPTKCLIQKVLPLIQQYHATAYLSGHDHNLQHLEVVRPGLTTEFFVIGAANFVDTSNKHKNDVPNGSSKFFWAKPSKFGGFAYIEAMPTNMTLTFIDGTGQRLYSKTLFQRMK